MSLGGIKNSKNTSKKKYAIVLLITIIVTIGIIYISIPKPDKLDHYISNKEVIHQVSNEIFQGIQVGTIQVGEVLSVVHEPKRVEELDLTKNLKQLARKNGIESVRVRDNHLIWFVEYGKGFTISGIAITKDGIPPNREDDYYKFDEGTLSYKAIDDNTYFFSAGL